MHILQLLRTTGFCLGLASRTLQAQVGVPGTGVVDVDGNAYPTLVYSNGQEWMADNLKTTKYNDGTDILLIDNDALWAAQAVPMPQNTPAYCWYGDDIANKELYGALYSWFVIDTVLNGGRNVCPDGWRVPSTDDRVLLNEHLVAHGLTHDGSTTITGPLNKLGKALADTALWQQDTVTVGVPGNEPEFNNGSGFTGRPGGSRAYTDGSFDGMGQQGHWWDSDDLGPGNPDQSTTYALLLHGGQSMAQHLGAYFGNKMSGKSIRCMRNVVTGLGALPHGPPVLAFPNPFTERITVDGLGGDALGRYTLLDATGRSVRSGTFTKDSTTIDTQALPAGPYVLVLQEGTGPIMRLIKE